MSPTDKDWEAAVRERAYFIWEASGRPEGRAIDHWTRAAVERRGRAHADDAEEDEERVMAGRSDANIPAMLTKDVPGG